MQKIIKKLAEAKKMIASQKITKEWKNTWFNFSYFTPEQVNWIVQKACEEFKLLTKFDLLRDEQWIEWQLTIYDIESDESIVFIWATAIPEIRATNVAQQMWWCMTYTERYLKMTAFWICDNSLDFDTTENMKKTEKAESKKTETKNIMNDWPFQTSKDLPRFNKEEFEQLKTDTTYVKDFETSNDLIESISTKYRISRDMKMKIADLRAENK